MDETKKEDIKEEEPEVTISNIGEGDKYETTPIIERAREEREKLEAATKALREENDRRELIMAKQALGGDSEAGAQAPKKAPVSDEEYANAAMRGELLE